MNLDNGFTPSLHALNRDLAAFNRRFGGKEAVVALRPPNYSQLSPEDQWKIDRDLGILDLNGES